MEGIGPSGPLQQRENLLICPVKNTGRQTARTSFIIISKTFCVSGLFRTKLWGAMPGLQHLFSSATWKAYKERGKEGPGEKKDYTTRAYRSRGNADVLLEQKNWVQVAFSLSSCNSRSSRCRNQQHSHYSHLCELLLKAGHTTLCHIIRCSHPTIHMLLYFFQCLTWQQKCERKILGKGIFSLTDFKFFLISASGWNSVHAEFKSHSVIWFREKCLEFWLWLIPLLTYTLFQFVLLFQEHCVQFST